MKRTRKLKDLALNCAVLSATGVGILGILYNLACLATAEPVPNTVEKAKVVQTEMVRGKLHVWAIRTDGTVLHDVLVGNEIRPLPVGQEVEVEDTASPYQFYAARRADGQLVRRKQ